MWWLYFCVYWQWYHHCAETGIGHTVQFYLVWLICLCSVKVCMRWSKTHDCALVSRTYLLNSNRTTIKRLLIRQITFYTVEKLRKSFRHWAQASILMTSMKNTGGCVLRQSRIIIRYPRNGHYCSCNLPNRSHNPHVVCRWAMDSLFLISFLRLQ